MPVIFDTLFILQIAQRTVRFQRQGKNHKTSNVCAEAFLSVSDQCNVCFIILLFDQIV